jgi:ribosomal protein L29
MAREERQKLIAEKRQDLIDKQRGLHSGEMMNPSSIRKVRRDIALILTIENEPAKKETK